LRYPLANPPVLWNLHAEILWGAFLVIAGLAYTLKFSLGAVVAPLAATQEKANQKWQSN
jgi:hypothetical protein